MFNWYLVEESEPVPIVSNGLPASQSYVSHIDGRAQFRTIRR